MLKDRKRGESGYGPLPHSQLACPLACPQELLPILKGPQECSGPTWSIMPLSALRSARLASFLVKRWTAPEGSGGSDTVLPTMMSSPETRVPARRGESH